MRLPDGYNFRWEEYSFTAYEFPGQTLHHGALLVEGGADGGSEKILFCGDSFAPTGMDDYCMQNRCFTGEGRGFRKCLDIIDDLKPGLIINSHQPEPFIFTGNETGFLRRKLDERDKLLSELSPWESPDISLDPYWLRLYPYVSHIRGVSPIRIEAQITSHFEGLDISLRFVSSGGRVSPESYDLTLPPPTCGYKRGAGDGLIGEPGSEGASAPGGGDVCVPLTFYPEDDRGVYVIGVQARINGRYYGEACKGVIINDVKQKERAVD